MSDSICADDRYLLLNDFFTEGDLCSIQRPLWAVEVTQTSSYTRYGSTMYFDAAAWNINIVLVMLNFKCTF